MMGKGPNFRGEFQNPDIKFSISSSVKRVLPLPHLSCANTIVLFVCMSEMLMEKEMAVMLSKILILLAGQPSETSSYLADMETKKREEGRVHPLLKCQDVINSYKVST